jgi:Domain of unknown function (DUF4276)
MGLPSRTRAAPPGSAQSQRGDVPVGVVLATQEFECWFLAAAESIAGHCELANDLEPPPHPESVGGAKRWLQRRMPKARRYAETVDQPRLTSIFDLQTARTSAPSFDKCWREIERLIEEAASPSL